MIKMDINLLIQNVLVGLLILGAFVWIGIRIYRIRKQGTTGLCDGCSLSESCGKKSDRVQSESTLQICEKEKKDNHEDNHDL